MEYMIALQEEISEFNQIYFDEKSRSLIQEAIKIDCEDDLQIVSREDENYYYDLSLYEDELFEDEDFLAIDDIYNNYKYGNAFFGRTVRDQY